MNFEIDADVLIRILTLTAGVFWMIAAINHRNDPSGVVYALLCVSNSISLSREG